MCSKQHVFPLLTAKSEGHGDMENSVKKKKKYPSHFQADKHRLPLSTMTRIQDHLSKFSESGRDISSPRSYPCRRDRLPNFTLFVTESMDVSKGKTCCLRLIHYSAYLAVKDR